MTKRVSRVISAILVLAMILTMLPAAAMATNEGESAKFLTGMPADGSYGVIYSCGEGYSHVMGYDIVGGDAASKAVELSEDGKSIRSLPDGTAIIKFIQNTDGSYYFMFGNKYLVLKDVDAQNKEKLVLSDTAENGAKWTIKPDQAGMDNAFNVMNAEYKWNGKYDVYLEQYNGSKWCGYSYNANSPQHFQFRFASTSADPDGRVGELQAAAALPVAGDTVVIHNAYANAVFGQPTAPDAPKPNLTGAAAKLKNGTLSYDDIGDGGLIFTVAVSGGEYTFQTGGKYLGMPDNYTNEEGKTVNDESLILRDEQSDYTKWTVSEINGGWLMKNKGAQWKGYPVYVEYFDDLFCGYSVDASRPQIFAMNFFKITDRYNKGYVVNPAVVMAPDLSAAIGTDCPVKFTLNDLNDAVTTTARYWFDGSSAGTKTAVATYEQKIGSFTIPSADLEGHKTLTI